MIRCKRYWILFQKLRKTQPSDSVQRGERANQAMQPTGICGGGIVPESKVGRAAYPGRLIAVVELSRFAEECEAPGTGGSRLLLRRFYGAPRWTGNTTCPSFRLGLADRLSIAEITVRRTHPKLFTHSPCLPQAALVRTAVRFLEIAPEGRCRRNLTALHSCADGSS